MIGHRETSTFRFLFPWDVCKLVCSPLRPRPRPLSLHKSYCFLSKACFPCYPHCSFLTTCTSPRAPSARISRYLPTQSLVLPRTWSVLSPLYDGRGSRHSISSSSSPSHGYQPVKQFKPLPTLSLFSQPTTTAAPSDQLLPLRLNIDDILHILYRIGFSSIASSITSAIPLDLPDEQHQVRTQVRVALEHAFQEDGASLWRHCKLPLFALLLLLRLWNWLLPLARRCRTGK
ncbi:hypothetical protein BDP55DRAFT_411552 [Colletotrichum godetiae]|uniref:Uncharacterized protein n=1 Tax=Colletotrichum godetiae TaxID=1209918 RepID=A0AAJ0ASH9_9PEZI|nr:uncharacterized protein BDP55DRAFT_411552 [Colletotrichum godetiae]KAK1689568.1 hypothetical protein BDP55DRAFT_411552 [Colletotrichum godetiae]